MIRCVSPTPTPSCLLVLFPELPSDFFCLLDGISSSGHHFLALCKHYLILPVIPAVIPLFLSLLLN